MVAMCQSSWGTEQATCFSACLETLFCIKDDHAFKQWPPSTGHSVPWGRYILRACLILTAFIISSRNSQSLRHSPPRGRRIPGARKCIRDCHLILEFSLTPGTLKNSHRFSQSLRHYATKTSHILPEEKLRTSIHYYLCSCIEAIAEKNVSSFPKQSQGRDK